jgi:hypothetical protein
MLRVADPSMSSALNAMVILTLPSALEMTFVFLVVSWLTRLGMRMRSGHCRSVHASELEW